MELLRLQINWFKEKRKQGYALPIKSILDLDLYQQGFEAGYYSCECHPKGGDILNWNQGFTYFALYQIRKKPSHEMWGTDTIYSYIHRRFKDANQGLDYFFDLFEQFQAHEASGAPPITLEDVQGLGSSKEELGDEKMN